MLRQVALNPLILACLLGFALSALGGLPPGLGPLLRALGGASVALGLLAVGAALTLGALRDRPLLQNLVAAQKLLLMPLLTLALARLFGLDALAADGAPPLKTLKVDGGVTANSFAMQFVADICEVEVVRPAFQEMTALGAARLAALGCGLLDDLEARPREAPAIWRPRMGAEERGRLLRGWRRAVRAAMVAAEDDGEAAR